MITLILIIDYRVIDNLNDGVIIDYRVIDDLNDRVISQIHFSYSQTTCAWIQNVLS